MRVRLGRAKTNRNVLSNTLRIVRRGREPGVSVIQAKPPSTNQRIARPTLPRSVMRRQDAEA